MKIARTKAVRAAAVAVALMAGLSLGTAPASANTNDGYVSGAGYTYDDWNDEGTVSVNSNASSNATCLWQKVLFAEGLLDYDDIDGIFGPETKRLTEALQSRWRMRYVDGIVGEATWTRAGQNLVKSEYVNFDSQRVYRMYYSGSSDVFAVYRGGNGRHGFYQDGGIFHQASYTSRTCR
jgi:peptidoglycan hydrolase-like protein with peptidoglycan-binding domain